MKHIYRKNLKVGNKKRNGYKSSRPDHCVPSKIPKQNSPLPVPSQSYVQYEALQHTRKNGNHFFLSTFVHTPVTLNWHRQVVSNNGGSRWSKIDEFVRPDQGPTEATRRCWLYVLQKILHRGIKWTSSYYYITLLTMDYAPGSCFLHQDMVVLLLRASRK